MPPINSKLLSSIEAQDRSNAGLSRNTQIQRTNNASHPSLGGSHGYSLYFRRDVLYWEARYGIEFVLRRFSVSRASVYRWKERISPYQQSGNKQKEQLTGYDQYLLSICLFVHPRAQSDQIATFIAANGGTAGISRQTVTRRSQELHYTRKRASLEAFEAYKPINMMRCELFFSQPPPVGIQGIPLRRYIDVDEAGFTLTSCEPKYGKALSCVRVRDTAHYKKGQKGLTLVLAVEPGNPALPPHVYGSIHNPRKWWMITVNNVNQVVFADFIDSILTDIEQNPVAGDEERILLWDNLSAHHTGLVTATVELRPTRPQFQFIIIPRPPYQPKYAPIEYIFCEIGGRLATMVQSNWTLLNLRMAIETCIVQIGRDCKLNRTFRHCLGGGPVH